MSRFVTPRLAIEARVWGLLLQLLINGRRGPGEFAPRHPRRHRFWIRLTDPLGPALCYWCGLHALPNPLALWLHRRGVR